MHSGISVISPKNGIKLVSDANFSYKTEKLQIVLLQNDRCFALLFVQVQFTALARKKSESLEAVKWCSEKKKDHLQPMKFLITYT